VAAIAVSGLRKAYGQREVLHGISFAVQTGEVFALLGPNGAGKTTTVEILEGYRRRDAGDVSVLGEDPERAGGRFRARIGIVLQSSAVYHLLTVREIVGLFAGYYPSPRRPDEVIDLVGLAETRGARVRTLSGGQLRRLDLALALVGDPELVFLDEPTTGFDPAAPRDPRESHLLDEVEKICDAVAIVDHGRVVMQGTLAELKGSPETILIGSNDGVRVKALLTAHSTIPTGGSSMNTSFVTAGPGSGISWGSTPPSESRSSSRPR